ncbi:hypothetical protein ACLVWU_12420 [Bdellovibrio sp. HCB290]|uniref:hypothetical protein n=1 Tax=Bdellovibrio sp. HCB290 TaxID=3394356 RepID=UPI0039B43638
MKISKLLATAVLMSLAACAVKDDKASSVALGLRGDDTPKGEATVNTKDGGQPGQIMVTGAIVKIDESKVNYDEPSDKLSVNPAIKITYIAGLAADGKLTDLDPDHKPMSNLTKSETILNEVVSDTSYVVFGCTDDQVDASYINGLTKKEVMATADQVGSLTSAKVVFVCGELKTTAMALAIKADTLILNSASIISTAPAGMVDIGANKLSLIGKNLIRTIGQDADSNVLPAASIEFNVTKELMAGTDGTLHITSKGGDIKKGAAQSTIGTSDQQKAKDQQEEQDLAGRMALDATR